MSGCDAGTGEESLHLKCLVMLHHGLGDFVMALPVIRALRSNRIEPLGVVVQNEAIESFGRNAVEDERIQWYQRPKSAVGWLTLAARIRRASPEVFLGVHAHGSMGGVFSYLTGAGLRVGPLPNWGYNAGIYSERGCRFLEGALYDEEVHKVRTYLEFLRPLGLDVDNMVPDVSIETSEEQRRSVVSKLLGEGIGQIVGIAPFCGEYSSHRQWYLDGWAELIMLLNNEVPEMAYALVGESKDAEAGADILDRLPKAVADQQVYNLIGNTRVEELPAIVDRFCLLVCVCSGMSHIAAGVGTPIVGIYGPTNPGFTGAWSDQFYVVRKGFSCSPCYRANFEKGCGNPRCMQDISPFRVRDACMRALGGRPPAEVPAMPNSLSTTFRR